MAKFIFVTGGVVSGLGKGITAASLGRLLKCRGLKVAMPEARPLYQRGPRHHEPLPARRGLRHRRRRRDRPGPGPLRALHRREPEQLLQPDHRQGLLERAQQGAPGRLPGRAPCRSSPTSPTRSRAASTAWAPPPSADVVITEIGGTVGDIESQPFLEAIRQVAHRGGPRKLPASSTSRWCPTSPARTSYKIQAHPALRQGAAGPSASSRTSSSAAADGRVRRTTSAARSPCSATYKPECVIENLTAAQPLRSAR